jgi:hypothetical protein
MTLPFSLENQWFIRDKKRDLFGSNLWKRKWSVFSDISIQSTFIHEVFLVVGMTLALFLTLVRSSFFSKPKQVSASKT